MLALSGSVLMVMLVSTLLFIPHVNNLQADITSPVVVAQVPQTHESVQAPEEKFSSTEDPQEIMKMIQDYVRKNNPDAAKKLYDQLYAMRESVPMQKMGAEVSEVQ